MMMMKTLFKHRAAHSAKAGIQRGPAQHYRFTSIEMCQSIEIMSIQFIGTATLVCTLSNHILP